VLVRPLPGSVTVVRLSGGIVRLKAATQPPANCSDPARVKNFELPLEDALQNYCPLPAVVVEHPTNL